MQEMVSQILTYQDDHCHKGISSGMTIFHAETEWVKLSGQCFIGNAYKTTSVCFIWHISYAELKYDDNPKCTEMSRMNTVTNVLFGSYLVWSNSSWKKFS